MLTNTATTPIMQSSIAPETQPAAFPKVEYPLFPVYPQAGMMPLAGSFMQMQFPMQPPMQPPIMSIPASQETNEAGEPTPDSTEQAGETSLASTPALPTQDLTATRSSSVGSSNPGLPSAQTFPELTTATSGNMSDTSSATTPLLQPAQPTFHPMQFVQPIMFPPQPQMNMTMAQQPMYVQVQTPSGPSLQPVFIMPEMHSASASPQNAFLGLPGQVQHPMMQRSRSDSSYSRGRRVSRSNSSLDGSEISDQMNNSNSKSLRRFSSGQSDGGYETAGSDYNFDNRSRMGSDYFTDEDHNDEEPKYEVQSPDQRRHERTARTARNSFEGNQNYHHKCKTASDNHHYRHYDRNGKKRPTSKERQEELYKTELCNAWINQRKCRFGQRCIFAHGQHELRMPKRKIERNKMRPPVQKQVIAILNKLTEANSENMITEFLTVCVEQIRSNEEEVKGVVRALFNKAVTEKSYRSLYANAWRKLLLVHPSTEQFRSAMFEMCLLEYATPRSKMVAIGCMEWIAELCYRHLFNEEIVEKILGDVHADTAKELQIELWCKLIESLKDRVDTSEYFDIIISKKSKYGQRIRFMIMDLEDLRRRDWVPRS